MWDGGTPCSLQFGQARFVSVKSGPLLKMEEKYLKMSLHEVDLAWKMSLGRLGVLGVSLGVYEHFLEA